MFESSLWFPRPPWVFLVKSSRSQAEKKLQASEEAMKALAEFDTLGSSELQLDERGKWMEIFLDNSFFKRQELDVCFFLVKHFWTNVDGRLLFLLL